MSAGPNGDRLAMRWIARDGSITDATYAQLMERTNRFASALQGLGIGRQGDRVFSLLGRVPELYITALGTLKNACVFCPLFSAFGPEPIRQRLALGDGRVLVTTPTLYRRKVAADSRPSCPPLEHVHHRRRRRPRRRPARLSRRCSLARTRISRSPAPTQRTWRCSISPAARRAPRRGPCTSTMRWSPTTPPAPSALDLHPDDVFWCTADPGWVTGTSYGIIAPLTHGVTSVVDEADFDAERWYRILQDQRVTVWYTAPTALRMLMKAGVELAREYDLSRLRFVASVGEPLNPEAVVWGQEALGLAGPRQLVADRDRRDHDRQPGRRRHPARLDGPALAGRRGRRSSPVAPTAGPRSATDGSVNVVDDPGIDGELALRPGWPSMFRDYLHEPERYAACFAGGWYLTGDVARRDARRLALVRRPSRRRHQVGRSSHRAVRGRERADGTPGSHRGRRHRRARSRRRRGRQGLRQPAVRLRAERRAAPRAHRLRPAPPRPCGRARGTSPSTSTCPRPRAARSCAACSKPASSACPRATCRPWRRAS